ncbi:outer envelope protein 64 mitochondrial [Phtheirospermum japonicum]|uniref:Outer envelope protein 64 mitochondrial n=1 Tax=Phtheirospermum japonicum TaxID=374723 RepID=A0A830BHK6_9LAMI|nr:outer envelope protein 64 mitochondrial [Phtheirospermum japonicum]
MSKLSKLTPSNPKVWVVIGVGLAGVLILAEVQRRRIKANSSVKEDFGAFVDRLELLPFPQPPPPAARLPLSGLTFAINDNIDVKGYVTGHGSTDWKKTHEAAEKTAVVITSMLRSGATCLGKTVMDELGFGILGENRSYGAPKNPQKPSHVPGGSSSGSAVAVAAKLTDFALGTDTIGGIRVPASFCGILGFRPSHGIVSAFGVSPNSQSLDAVELRGTQDKFDISAIFVTMEAGCLASDPSVLHRVGHVLLQLNPLEPKRTRRIIIADDLFQLCKVPMQRAVHIVTKAIEKLPGYQTPKHVNFGQYIASNVPSLKSFYEEPTNQQTGMSTLKALSSVMLLLQRYEFKTNHEVWIKSAKPKLDLDVSNRVWEAINTTQENVKSLYKVRMEMRAALKSLLKDDGILVIPTVADPPPKLNSRKSVSSEFYDRIYALLSIASMSGGCQVTIPLGRNDDSPVSVSYITSHGTDKFLLDTVLDTYPSLQEQANVVSNSPALTYTNGNMDESELLKEKGNAAYKGKQWNKAVNYYTEAIKLNEINATYYCNRAAAYLEMGCFQQAEEDCTKAMSLDKKNVKAYLRRGTARESLLYYKEALQDFRHALVLEPQNKVASVSEKRLRRLIR